MGCNEYFLFLGFWVFGLRCEIRDRVELDWAKE